MDHIQAPVNAQSTIAARQHWNRAVDWSRLRTERYSITTELRCAVHSLSVYHGHKSWTIVFRSEKLSTVYWILHYSSQYSHSITLETQHRTSSIAYACTYNSISADICKIYRILANISPRTAYRRHLPSGGRAAMADRAFTGARIWAVSTIFVYIWLWLLMPMFQLLAS